MAGQGKTAFAHVADMDGRVQAYFRKDELGDALFAQLADYDLGDWVGVSGSMMRTRTGEATIRVTGVELLSKALRPLPLGKEQVVDGEIVRYSAFADTEQRARQRYADLAVHPEVRALFRARSLLTRSIRTQLDALGYLEVETPVLQPLYGGASARPFVTHHNALDMPLYLRIADELYLKRLIVGGFERVYEIGHDFRNEGIDRTHNPEFTMLEFYEAFADYETMMSRVETLLVGAAAALRAVPGIGDAVPELTPPFPRIPWVGSLSQAAGTDVMAADDATLRQMAERIGVSKVATLSRPKVLDEMFQALVESHIDTPTFVVDYPVEFSPLAKPKRGRPGLTERFRVVCARQGTGQRVLGIERPHRPARAVRSPAPAARRRRRRSLGRRRGLSARDGVRHAAHRRRRDRHRPVVHVPHQHGQHPRCDSVSHHAPRVGVRGLELAIAWRYLRSRRGSRLLSLISVIAIGGVLLGVSALIIIMGVMNGMQRDLRDKILVGSADLRALPYGIGYAVGRIGPTVRDDRIDGTRRGRPPRRL